MTVNDATTVRGDFKFRLWSGEQPYLRVSDAVEFSMRRSAAGNRVLVFPEPYADLSITEGERIGDRKWARIQAAIDQLETRGGA